MMWLADLFIKKTPKELGMLGLTSNPSTPEAVSGYQAYFWDIISKKTIKLPIVRNNYKHPQIKNQQRKEEKKKSTGK